MSPGEFIAKPARVGVIRPFLQLWKWSHGAPVCSSPVSSSVLGTDSLVFFSLAEHTPLASHPLRMTIPETPVPLPTYPTATAAPTFGPQVPSPCPYLGLSIRSLCPPQSDGVRPHPQDHGALLRTYDRAESSFPQEVTSRVRAPWSALAPSTGWPHLCL